MIGRKAGLQCPGFGIDEISCKLANILSAVYGMPSAGTRCDCAAALQILADFCIWFLSRAEHCFSQSALEWKPFSPVAHLHPLLLSTNFPNMEKVWMHKKDSTFILAGIRHCFTVLWLHWSLLALKSPVSWRGRPQIAERRNTFTHVVAPSSLHKSFQLLSKFPNKNLSQWFCIGRSKAQLGV